MTNVVTPEPADAIVFVGGLSGEEHMRPERVAEILCWELEQQADDRLATFSVRSLTVENELVHRIERVDVGVNTPVVDLYCVAHEDPDPGTPQAVASRVLTLALQVIAGGLIWGKAWFGRGRKAKSPLQKWQLGFCLLILLCLGVYFLTALWALGEAIYSAVAGAGSTLDAPQWIVLATTVLGVLWPNARAMLTSAAESYQQMMRYVWTSGERNHLTGRIHGLVDKINHRPGIKNVNLLGYSFGALAVLDTVYPASSAGQQAMQQVRTIVTVGCPFDVIRLLRPTYATGRGTATDTIPNWINVYAPIDLLASNFTNGDAAEAEPTAGITLLDGTTTRKPTVNATWNGDLKLNVVNVLMLPSLRAHGEYWDDKPSAHSAFGLVVDKLYTGTPVLA